MDPAWEDMDQDTDLDLAWADPAWVDPAMDLDLVPAWEDPAMDLDLDQAPVLAWVDLEAWEDLAMDPTLARMTTTMMQTR